MGSVKHKRVAEKNDGPNDGRVQPSWWNDDHDIGQFLSAIIDLAVSPLTVPYIKADGTGGQFQVTALALALLAKAAPADMLGAIGGAPLDSPNLTGTPTAPTATLGTNSNQIATMRALADMRADLVQSSPETLNTLGEIAAALGNDPNFATTILNALSGRLRFDDEQSLTSGQKAQALENLGLELSTVARSGAYADLSGKPALGTAAATDIGTGANDVVQLDGDARMPAVDGSRLTGIANKNYVLNGAMMVSQENGQTAATGSVTGYFPVDQFTFYGSYDGSVSVAQVAAVTPAGSPNRIRVSVVTSDLSIGATQYACILTSIEGARIADLGFGGAGAKNATLSFGVNAPAGTYGVALLNADSSRSYVAEYTISPAEANVDVRKSVTIPGDMTGTWRIDDGVGVSVFWSLSMGSNYQGTANVWQASNIKATASQFNFLGAGAGARFDLFDVKLEAGDIATGFIVPDFAETLDACQRYWEASYSYGVRPGTVTDEGRLSVSFGSTIPNNSRYPVRFSRPKRTGGAVTLYNPHTGTANKVGDGTGSGSDVAASVAAIGMTGGEIIMGADSPIGIIFHFVANARL